MELSALVFALVLFSAGIWLVFMVSGDFKEKKRHVQKIPAASHKSHHGAATVASAGARREAASTLRVSVNASTAQVEAADRLQNINAAVVRETFERLPR